MGRESRSIGISRTVIVLGVVSFLTDMSSEGIYPLIPLYLTAVLHVQAINIGIIEGIAESTACMLRVFSGYFSDRLGNRKWLTVSGYGLSTISKPLFAFTTSWQQVLGVRFADRLGKGIRSAPRDALIADVSPPDKRGISFGFHRTMDTIGAITGPLIAFWLLRSLHFGYRSIFLLSAIPAALAVLVLIFLVREPARAARKDAELPELGLKSLSRRFKSFLLVAGVFSLGNSSDVFLILRANHLGIGAEKILLVYMLFNSVEAALSITAGAVSDRIGRRNVILGGYLVFALVYAGFGFARRPAEIWALFAFYGVYNALTQGVQRAFAADLAKSEARGTGLGAYYTATGIALLPASLIAGYLWQYVSKSAPFFYGSALALVASVLLAVLFRDRVPTPQS